MFQNWLRLHCRVVPSPCAGTWARIGLIRCYRHVSLCLSLSLSVSLPVSLSVSLSVCLSLSVSLSLSVRLAFDLLGMDLIYKKKGWVRSPRYSRYPDSDTIVTIVTIGVLCSEALWMDSMASAGSTGSQDWYPNGACEVGGARLLYVVRRVRGKR